MKLAVTGGRTWGHTYDRTLTPRLLAARRAQRLAVYRALSALRPSFLSVGDATGADRCALDFAEFEGIPYARFDADWRRFGANAGHRRNVLLVAGCDALVAFPGGSGTRDCIARARAIRIEVVVIDPNKPLTDLQIYAITEACKTRTSCIQDSRPAGSSRSPSFTSSIAR